MGKFLAICQKIFLFRAIHIEIYEFFKNFPQQIAIVTVL